MSCKKQEFKSNPPLAPVPINKDTTIAIDNSVSFKGETWILTSYKIGDYSTPIVRNDTLKFINNKTYSFNKQLSFIFITILVAKAKSYRFLSSLPNSAASCLICS